MLPFFSALPSEPRLPSPHQEQSHTLCLRGHRALPVLQQEKGAQGGSAHTCKRLAFLLWQYG